MYSLAKRHRFGGCTLGNKKITISFSFFVNVHPPLKKKNILLLRLSLALPPHRVCFSCHPKVFILIL